MKKCFLISLLLIAPIISFADTSAVQSFLSRLTYASNQQHIEAARKKYGDDLFSKWLEDQMNPIEEKSLDKKIKKLYDSQLSQFEKENYTRKVQIRKMMLASESDNQLREMLVDFWFNNFSVDSRIRNIHYMVTSYEDGLRDNVFKTFKDMMTASISHPAMIVYLDAVMNEEKGTNENYARELMEIETLGFGYSQKDVEALSKIITGWTLTKGHVDRKFLYVEEKTDKSQKTWMGHKFEGKGKEDILKMIDIISKHENTAASLCRKLVKFYVHENGLPELEKKCSAEFMKTEGDLKSVYRVVFLAPELRQGNMKIKKPFHFMAGFLRSSGANPDFKQWKVLVEELYLLKEESYLSLSPKGYSDEAGLWATPFQLLFRNTVLEKHSELIRKGSLHKKIGKKNLKVEQVAEASGIRLSEESVKLMNSALVSTKTPKKDLSLEMMKLIFSSPEFQRR